MKILVNKNNKHEGQGPVDVAGNCCERQVENQRRKLIFHLGYQGKYFKL